MKKTYMAPTIWVVKIQTTSIIASSIESVTANGTNITTSNQFGARESDFDDEEW